MTAEMQDCVECQFCHSTCTETIGYCLDIGSARSRAYPPLMDCVEICQTSADFMLRGSDEHGIVCRTCAEVCSAVRATASASATTSRCGCARRRAATAPTPAGRWRRWRRAADRAPLDVRGRPRSRGGPEPRHEVGRGFIRCAAGGGRDPFARQPRRWEIRRGKWGPEPHFSLLNSHRLAHAAGGRC
jgi:hypothetical protein